MLPVRVAVSAGTYAAGTWSGVAGFEKLDLDLNTLATVPTGATCAIFHANTNTTGARFGAQDSNGDDEFYLSDSSVPGRQDFAIFIPINGTETVDLFVTNTTNCVIYLMGYMSHPTFITPVGVSGGITSATVTTIDLGTTDIVPVGAANGSVLVTVNKICKLAGSAAALSTMLKPPNSTLFRAYAVVPLDADRKFYVESYASFGGADELRVVAWMTPEGYKPETTYTSEQVAAVNTWTPSSKISIGAYDHWRLNGGTTTTSGSSTLLRGMRPSGDTNYTTAIDGDTAVRNPYTFVIPNGSGEVDLFNAVTNAVKFERHGSFSFDTEAPSILSIDTFVEGATATITLDASVASFTSLAIKGTDDHILTVASFSGSGDTWTFTVPPIADEEEGVRIGTVLITPTTSGGVGEEYATTYTKTDYVLVELEDVLTPNLGTVVGATPAFKSQDIGVSLGTQVAYNPAEVTIDVHGGLDWAVDGVHSLYYYDPDDFTWRLITLTTEDGAPSTVGGLTSSGLTSSGLTRAGLTSSGL